jgi:hypothetical protein
VLPRNRRELAFVVIGVITPLGILAVNASAFVMQHLDAFRLVLSVCAFVSALFLNGLSAYAALRRAHVHVPDLLAEYRRWAIATVVIVVVASAAFGAYFTYLGMRDPRRLPDPTSVITAALLLLVPFALTWGARRYAARRSSREAAEKRKGRPAGRPFEN